MKLTKRWASLILATGLVLSPTVHAGQPVMVNVKRMSMETALKIARAAIAECRKRGVQVGVTVVDRNGIPQVVLRDVLAPDITLGISRGKAHAAASFNAATSSLENRFRSPSGVGAKARGLIFSAGGVPVRAGGSILGGVGVSGAPSGKTDEACAAQGVKAVQDDLELAG